MIALEILLVVVLHVAVLAGLLAVVLGLSGNFILLGIALVVAWIGGFEHLTLAYLIGFLVLAVFGEIVEALLGVVAAKGFGASRWGMIGTFIGGIAGAALGTGVLPVVGSILGAFLGAFVGAFVGELLGGKGTLLGARAGFGAFLGKVAATSFKLVIGFMIAFYTLKAAYPLVG
jgi:uncharacterized protein YqgC (DUF456 family)